MALAEPSQTSETGGKISRGRLLGGLARALSRAWIEVRTDGPRRPPPSADDDPFPQGEPADALSREEQPVEGRQEP